MTSNLLFRLRLACGWALSLDPDVRHPFTTSAVVIVRRVLPLWSDGKDFLAIHRDEHSGQIGLPGGSVFWYETPREAALRETGEEAGIGVPLHALRYLGCWADGGEKKRPTFAFYCTLPAGRSPIAEPRQVEARHPIEWVERLTLTGARASFRLYNARALTALDKYQRTLRGGLCGSGFDRELWLAYQRGEIK